MKKNISLFLALILLLFIPVFFVSCRNKEEQSPSYVYLNKDNFDNYFAVNVSYDYQIIHLGQDSSARNHYDIFCTVTITTAPNGNYTYGAVEVEYKYQPVGLFGWEIPDPTSLISVNIGADGYSSASFTAVMRDTTNITKYTFKPTAKNLYLSYANISGIVYLPSNTSR